MSYAQQAHAIQQEVEKHGVAAVDYPANPIDRDRLQTGLHQISKQYGMKVRSKRMFVEGENLLVVWRVS